MKQTLRYLVVLMILMVIGWIKVPQWFDMKFPRSAGPEFDRQIRYVYMDRINDEHPDIVLLGDSTLSDGVDAEQLAALTGKRIAKFDVPGSASAFWYLAMKNNIVEADSPPSVVVLFFRSTILTAPGYRVHGSYFIQVDEFARKNEPVLLEKSFLNLMNPADRVAEEYVPLYGARIKIRRSIDGLIRYSLPGWLGCDQQCTDIRMYDVFQASDLERGQLQSAVATAEQYLYAPSQLNFGRQLDQSYLPDMIQLAKENGIQLVLIRVKIENGNRNMDIAPIKAYMADLSEYLESQDVLLLDYGTDPRLTPELFKDALHLTKDGQNTFTLILAEGLYNNLK